MEKRLSATCRTASFALAGYCEARANGRTYLRHRERHTARRPGPRENRHRKVYRPKAFSTIRETVHGTRANERRQGIPDGGIRTETQYGVRPGIRGFGRPDGARCPSLSINLGYRGGERERRANSKQEVVRQVRFLRVIPAEAIAADGVFYFSDLSDDSACSRHRFRRIRRTRSIGSGTGRFRRSPNPRPGEWSCLGTASGDFGRSLTTSESRLRRSRR